MRFTTRPEIAGTFGVVASTHWIASAVGFGVLERGGNAFDAAVAAGFVLQVVEPHLNGPGGEVPILFHSARTGRSEAICGQGVAPAAATAAGFRAMGLELAPASGLLATVTPGAFDAWMLMLRDHGTLGVAEALAPAIHYAEAGHPILPQAASAIAGLAEFFRTEWPSSAEVWMPAGEAPAPRSRFANPDLAATYRRIAAEAEAADGRVAGIEAARRCFHEGFVAEAIDRFCREAELADATGFRARGLLTGADLAGWRARYEAPVALDYGDWTLLKTGPWGQGPVLLQALQILKGFDIGAMDPTGPDFAHVAVEAIKLAYADREAYYGDPDHSDIPLGALLSDAYAAGRRGLIGKAASMEQRPGRVPGFERLAEAAIARAARSAGEIGAARPEAGIGEPTMAHLGEPTMAHLARRPGDTTHLDVIDRDGNMVSATPSGGWLQSSPVVPGLGFPLNNRMQMFWLDEGLPSTLAPGRRPRTTLTPSLAWKDGRPAMVFGTPGGDQQDQWQLVFFLRVAHHGMNLQEAIDAPLFHSLHFTGSFYLRRAQPGAMLAEPGLGEATIAELRRRGHEVRLAEPWTLGRLTAAARDPDGGLRAAATPRLMQAYAVGR